MGKEKDYDPLTLLQWWYKGYQGIEYSADHPEYLRVYKLGIKKRAKDDKRKPFKLKRERSVKSKEPKDSRSSPSPRGKKVSTILPKAGRTKAQASIQPRTRGKLSRTSSRRKAT